MNHIEYYELSERLDKIASSLEDQGLMKDAEYLDIIANTLEKEAGLKDGFKKAIKGVKDLASKLPGANKIMDSFKGKSVPQVLGHLIKSVGTISEEEFEMIKNVALGPRYNSRQAAVGKKIIMGAVLLTMLAGIGNKALADMSFEDYKKAEQSKFQSYMQQEKADFESFKNDQSSGSAADDMFEEMRNRSLDFGSADLEKGNNSIKSIDVPDTTKDISFNKAIESPETSAKNMISSLDSLASDTTGKEIPAKAKLNVGGKVFEGDNMYEVRMIRALSKLTDKVMDAVFNNKLSVSEGDKILSSGASIVSKHLD